MYRKGEVTYRALPLPDRADPSPQASLGRRAGLPGLHAHPPFGAAVFVRPVDRAVIEAIVATAGSAPSGANHQPWHFTAIADPSMKARIREAAEEEERAFYSGGAGDEWLAALEPIGTGVSKPHLTDAPWLIVVFAQRWGENQDGSRYKNYYVPESVASRPGFLIAAIHHAGWSVWNIRPNPMKFLGGMCGRPASDKPVMILPVGHPAADATVPEVAKRKKPLSQILSVF